MSKAAALDQVPEGRRLLWVHGHIAPGAAMLRLLTFEGFQVDCVGAGPSAITHASARDYDAILFDLRLDDVSGLAVLEALTGYPKATPIIVLAESGDIESAVVAMKMGAADYKRLPLSSDELAGVLRTNISDAGHRQVAVIPSRCQLMSTPYLPCADAALTALLMGVRPFVWQSASLDTATDQAVASTRHVPDGEDDFTVLLLSALVEPSLSLMAFYACADALRQCLITRGMAPSATPRERAYALLNRLTHVSQQVPRATVRSLIAKLETSLDNHTRPHEEALAAELGVAPSHLGRLLKSQTGLDFRQWRRGLAMKRGVRHVISGDTQVSQIAYAVGFDHPSQFDREFRQTFGLTPTAFRRFVKPLLASSRCVTLSSQLKLTSLSGTNGQ